eukprot:TRINITY_DN16489_c0_g1_i1.p1 TRINITY_DN16489_c0_g1~~TRINITY_DN16489_c0_g1_i1.p1  ORF type:complete len:171 (-),score=38.53 TRINITY_DN16489_c0_g1_i1:34-546(-)
MEFRFDPFPSHSIHLFLFDQVSNSDVLLQKLLNLEIEMALMNTEMIVDHFQVLVAANMALSASETKTMKTKNVHSELVYLIAANKNINPSIKAFGINKTSSRILVAVFDGTREKLDSVGNMVQGNSIELSQLSNGYDELKVKKNYKITDHELKIGTLLDAIVNAIVNRET